MIQYNIENLAARLQNGNTTCTVVSILKKVDVKNKIFKIQIII